MIDRKSLCFLTLFVTICSVRAQSTRADIASRTSSQVAATQAAQSTSNTLSFQTEADSDLGRQQPVSAKSGGLGAYLIGETGLVYTSNPSLSNGGGQGDMYYYARGGFGIHPNIVGGLYLDGHVSEEVFQYAHFSSLDFNHFNAGGGLDYVFDNLGQLTVWARYEYDRYLDSRSFSEFFVNNSIVTGAGKEFILKDNFSIQLGGQAAISVTANPSDARRNEFDLWTGFRWRIIDPVELQTYYVVSIFYYPDGERTDVTQNVGASLNVSLTRWARVTAAAGFAANSSTDSYFDYTMVNVGGNLGLDIRF